MLRLFINFRIMELIILVNLQFRFMYLDTNAVQMHWLNNNAYDVITMSYLLLH